MKFKICLSDAPLLLSYIIFPIVMFGTGLLELKIPRQWLDVSWVMLFLVSSTVVLASKKQFNFVGYLNSTVYIFYILLFMFLMNGLMYALSGNYINIYPLLLEAKLLFYLLFSIVWFMSFGGVNIRYIPVYGAILGIVIIVGLVVGSIERGYISRSVGSGEINYDAMLLLLAFVASIYSKERVRVIYLWLIFLGLLATMSRTMILSLLVIVFIFEKRISLFSKLLLMCVGMAVVMYSFYVRDLEFTLDSLDRYWMWYSAMQLLVNLDPVILFGAFPAGGLPVIIPEPLEWLWGHQAEGWGVEGIFSFQYHAFWLRLFLTWGIVGCIIFTGLLIYFYKIGDAIVRPVAIIIILAGFTMGVFYISNAAIVIWLLVLSALKSKYLHRYKI